MIRTLFLSLLFISSIANQIFSQTESLLLAGLHDEAIQKNIVSIKQELSRTRLYKRIIVGAGIGALTYGTYYLFFRDPLSVAEKTVLQEQTGQDAPKKVTHQEIIKKIEAGHIEKQQLKVIVDFIERQRAASGFTGTFKRWAAATANFVLRESAVALMFSAVMGTFGKYFRAIDSSIDAATGKVFHDDTLQWYLATHTTIFSLLNDLEWHAYCIEHKMLPKKMANDAASNLVASAEVSVPLDAEQVAYHTAMFVRTWELCINNFESILGFMVMKVDEIKSDVQADGIENGTVATSVEIDTAQEKKKMLAQSYETIIKNMYEMIDSSRAKLEQIILKNDNKNGLIMEVNRFRTLFMERRAAFTACENH